MYIAFDLITDIDTGRVHEVAAWLERFIEKELSLWSIRYEITYKSKLFKGVKRVTFEQDEHYSFFTLTWNPVPTDLPSKYYSYRLVEPMKVDSN
jgi:hypothetical protein